MKRTWTVGVLTASTSALCVPAALAQSNPEVASTAAEETGSLDEEIVVTGTRLTTGGFQSPTPVNVVNTDELIKRAPGQLADALNQLPVFQNSINGNQQQFTQGNRQRTGNYLNLRSLGTQRVLVLQDGQRLPVSGTNGGVDVTLVPQLLTKRIDVVTGGASAAYGSDAVSGVVNFILDKQFTGLKAQAQYGTATRGYGDSYRLGVAGGASLLDGRLHVIGSIERTHSNPVLRSDMPSIADLWTAVGAGTSADPIRYDNDIGYGSVNAAGVTQNGPAGFINMQFGQNGQLLPFDRGAPSGNPGTQKGGDRGVLGQDCCTITPGQTANQAFARAEYEFADELTGFVSVGYNWSSAHDYPFSFLRTQITLFRDNAYLAPSALAALGPAESFNIGKAVTDVRGYDVNQYSDSLNIIAGLNGKLGAFNWSVGYSHAETKFRTTAVDMENTKLYAALDAVRDPSVLISAES
jgi:outer membrane receptor protein involved in Fe transport